jgi:hypothetical protein
VPPRRRTRSRRPGVPSLAAFRLPQAPALAVGLLCLACAAEPAGVLDTGEWGGTGIALHVNAADATLEFDCAHARIPSSLQLADGRFSVPGALVLEHGGPVHENEIPDERPARFDGVLSGSTLRLTIRLDADDALIGPFQLRRDQPPVLRKCL